MVAALAVWGWASLRRAPLDAIPDLSDAQVIVFTEWMGRSPDLVEDQVTYPIVGVAGRRAARARVRGHSMFGMSFVYVDLRGRHRHLLGAQPRARVPEHGAGAASRPASTPTLGPDATGVGWVFEYALVDDTGKHDLAGAAHAPGLARCATRWRACPASPRSRASAAS